MNANTTLLRRFLCGAATLALIAGATLATPTPHGIDLGGTAALADQGGNGKGHSGNHPGHGHGLGHADGSDSDSADAGDLGRLNAAHASATARTNAAPSSAVGEVASYEHDVQTEGGLAAAAGDLAAAANKDIVEPVVHAVNDLLGIDDNVIASSDDGTSDDDALDPTIVHETEGEISARVNGTYNSDADGDTTTP